MITSKVTEGLDYGWQALANISSQRPLRGLIMAGKGENIIPKTLRRLILGYQGLKYILKGRQDG